SNATRSDYIERPGLRLRGRLWSAEQRKGACRRAQRAS
ncbi:MAG: hypothetical protein RIQ96_1317, partial [Pseudomonadota bacterium]